MVSIYINLVNFCNLSCDYCYADGGTYNCFNETCKIVSSDISIKGIKDYLVYKRVHYARIIFFGGEPLLAFNSIKEIVAELEKINSFKFKYGIVTNGVGITEEVAQFFKKYEFLITVSFEGTESAQNVRKYADGRSSYEDVLNGIHILEKELVPYNIRMTFTRNNIFLRERLSNLSDLSALKSIRATIVSPTNCKVDVVEEDLNKYEEELFSIIYEDPLLLEKYAPIRNLEDVLYSNPKNKIAKCCLMGVNGIAIDVNGDVYPCYRLVGMKNYLIGNINDEGNLDFDWYNALYEFGEKAKCRKCDFGQFCQNICYAENIYTTGKFEEMWKLRCKETDINIRAAKMLKERREE